ncbi:MAG: hypothetical protein AB7T06_11065 [Kofleriaceae bacterium]
MKKRTVEVLRQPTKAGYQRVTVKRVGERVHPLELRGLSFEVADAALRRRRAGTEAQAFATPEHVSNAEVSFETT